MDSKRLKLLERAYAAEVNAALGGHQLHMMQTKAALAETMVEEGYLAKCKVKVSGATVEGYELTHVGRMAYCMECEDELPNEAVGNWLSSRHSAVNQMEYQASYRFRPEGATRGALQAYRHQSAVPRGRS